MVLSGDYIYGRQDEFASPVVVEKHKLIFFLVPGVEEKTWIRLFRRMMGYRDWKKSSSQRGLVHLYDYNISRASALMTDPNYARVVFVRDPKERISLAYTKEHIKKQCCRPPNDDPSCLSMLAPFGQFLDLVHLCDRPHWRPQGKRMEPKYFDTLNFVGHMETIRQDAKRLLKSIGAWDKYGKTGWDTGTDNTSEIFANVSLNARQGYNFPFMAKYYGEVGVDYFYRSDYENEKLNLTVDRSRYPLHSRVHAQAPTGR